NNQETYYNRYRLVKYYSKGVWIILLIKNLKLKLGKLIFKFISPFKILEYISESIYKLEFLNLYNRLYLTFYIFLFEEYIIKKE
ncbi:hypothetical protein NA56DRAFT_588034, partial [Hyaloscypha hepaticicola]